MNKSLSWRDLSISSTLLALLAVSLLISQGVDATLFLRDRSSLAMHVSIREAAGKAADLIALLDNSDQNGREQVRRSFQQDLDITAAESAAMQRPASEPARLAVASLLQARFKTHQDVQVLPPSQFRPVDIFVADRFNSPGPSFDILTTLRGGQPVVIRVVSTANGLPAMRVVLSFLVTMIVTLCVGTFIFARSITRRLRRLAVAAEAVGRGLEPPCIPESGPPELRLAARAFNRMQDRLRRYLGGRTRVVAAMSHDLRTPITRLRLRVASVSDPTLQSKMTADLEQMASMVQESLDTLQGMEAAESLRLVRIEPLLRALQSDYEELGFPVEVHNTVIDSVPARPQALRRLLTNLLDNARRFATTASIRVYRRGDDCIFLIGDNGPGIPEAELERVFEPFYRLEPSRNRGTAGAGLGLSIARDITYAHGGNLTLANKPGGGLEAKLTLPMEQSTATDHSSTDAAAQPYPESMTAGTPHRTAAARIRDKNPSAAKVTSEQVPGRVNWLQ